MTRSLLTIVMCCCGAATFAQDVESGTPGEWGTVTGRVVFEGDMDAPAVRSRLDDVRIYARQTIRDSLNRVPRRLLGKVPNHALVIDDKTRGVANAFVYLRRKPARIDPALVERQPKPIELVYRDRLFFPRAFIVHVGQTVRLVSRKGNVDFRIQAPSNQEIHPLVSPEKPVDWTPTKRERFPIPIRSNLQMAATSWCLVVDHPYAVLTGTDGSFELKNLPAGELKLNIWHETMGYVASRVPITVKPGKVEVLPPVVLRGDRVR